ncbi:Cupredoxin [Apiospora marii]|uniref:Cupredoxin n=1 Tax=Apiospora marii TaxID=335849 RepID=UPI00312F48B1
MRVPLSSLLLLPLVSAKTLEYYWELSWKFVAPDGFGRPVVSVNDEWPPPAIEGVIGDRVIVHVINSLGNESSGIHWHGIQQVGTNTMDGPVGVTQCPIPPGSRSTYNFPVNQAGTYWWHAHIEGQVADGLRGAMNFKDPHAPYEHQIDGERTITLGDWYHTQAPFLIEQYESAENAAAGGPEPIPDSGVINSGQNVTVHVEDGKTYLLRVVNLGNFVGAYFEVEGHQLTIVEADGVYLKPVTVDRLYLTVAQRYAVLLTLKKPSAKRGAVLMKAQLDTSMFDSIPPNYDPNFYGYLVCDEHKPLPTQNPITDLTVKDDIDFITSTYNPWISQAEVYDHVDHQIVFTMDFTTIDNQNRAIIDNVTYVPQKVPTLYTALTVGKYADQAAVYGRHSNPLLIKSGDVVEVIINNHDDGGHPWHTHGYWFQVIARTPTNSGDYAGEPLKPPRRRPLQRDTVMLNAGAYLAIRFRANNPGVHLFHCHIEWHVVSGLVATLIQTPTQLQGGRLQVPRDQLEACRRLGIPTAGNAAGNTRDPLDLAGANDRPPPHPMGALVNRSALEDPHRPRKGHPAWPYWPEKGHHHKAGGYRGYYI